MKQTLKALALLTGVNIRRERTRKDLSQEVLAGIIGRTPQYISLLENGRRCGSLNTYLKIANELDVDLSKLFIYTKVNVYHPDDERGILELFCDATPYERRVMVAVLTAARIALQSDT